MKIYLFEPETGIYQGEDFADFPSTVTTAKMPPGTTCIEPPPYGRGEVLIFDKVLGQWEIRSLSDLRKVITGEATP